MPKTREEHVHYTRYEFLSGNHDYYNKLKNYLQKTEDIESYLDLGANVGETWNVIKELVPRINKAYLIEAHPENFKFLISNIKYKDLCFGFNLAIDYSNKEYLSLIDDAHHNVGGYLLRDTDNGLKVRCCKLEDLNIDPVDLIKIDVEGCEYDIIKNSSYIKNCKYLEIEFHGPDKSINFEDPKTFIENNLPNYEIILNQGDYYRILLKKIK